jgi:hypothetical protein
MLILEKRPGAKPKPLSIKPRERPLLALQARIGGRIDVLQIAPGIDAVFHDDFLFDETALWNVALSPFPGGLSADGPVPIAGTVICIGVDEESGGHRGLTIEELAQAGRLLAEHVLLPMPITPLRLRDG